MPSRSTSRNSKETVPTSALSEAEQVKEESNNLRGQIRQELADAADRFSSHTTALLKFHGTYQQEDRDRRSVARQNGGERHYMCMIRSKVPGGRLTAEQFLTHSRIAATLGNGTLRITSRQDFQLHGVLKGDLHSTISMLNDALVTTLGACGDIARNVVTCPAPDQDRTKLGLERIASEIAQFVLPKGRGYHEIWIDGELATPAEPEDEPLYGQAYLPRKFKIAIAYPGDNCIDVYTNDLGFVPYLRRGQLAGFTLLAGGGLGMTHHKKETFPRLADPIAFISPEQLLPAVEAVIGVHRDFGDRQDRRHARLKYVVAEMGLSAFRCEVARRMGTSLDQPRPLQWHSAADHLGWQRQDADSWYLGLPIENGRLSDTDERRGRSGLNEIVTELGCEVRLTPQQNLLLCGIPERERRSVDDALRRHGMAQHADLSNVVLNGLACPALPTCGLALAESERVFPSVLRELERELERLGLAQEQISVRMTGCPNGCARPYTAEIGFVGRSAGLYDIYVGGEFNGTRLAQVLEEAVAFDRLIPRLVPVLEAYRDERLEGERLGAFCARTRSTKHFELMPVAAPA